MLQRKKNNKMAWVVRGYPEKCKFVTEIAYFKLVRVMFFFVHFLYV